MSMRKVSLVDGEFFHLYNRGNTKQQIFLDKEDYSRFVKLLYLCNSEYRTNFREDIVKKHINAFDFKRGRLLIKIGAWVLMPNYFHLYVFIPSSPKQGFGLEETSNITKFMHRLCTSYSKYFNKKYNRTGKLFEDKFKAVHIKNENQAKYLFSYIHINPVKLIQKNWKEWGIRNKGQVIDFLNNYKWSSFQDFQGIIRDENKIIDPGSFPLSYFSTRKSFKKEIFEWLSIDD